MFMIQEHYEPLIGNVAPDFEAEAVFDQEFIKVWYRPSSAILLRSINFANDR